MFDSNDDLGSIFFLGQEFLHVPKLDLDCLTNVTVGCFELVSS